EDDTDTAEMLTMMLHRDGHSVVVAYSLKEAMPQLDQVWDVIISDLGLPDGSGLEIAERTKNGSRPGRLIALRGFGSPRDLEATRQAGFDDHLVKPPDLEKLRRAMEPTQN